MIRIGMLLGLLAGWVEVAFVHALGDWAGAGHAVLWLGALDLAVGAAAGVGLALLCRLVAGRSAHDGLTWIFGTVALALPLFCAGWIVHAHFATWQKGLVVLLTGVSWIVTAAVARSRSERDSSAGLPRLATLGIVGLAVAWGGLAASDLRDPQPLGPIAAVTPGVTPASAPHSPGAALTTEEEAPKLIVVGIDGGTWDVMLPLIDRGQMPHLEGLLERGVGGVLEAPLKSFSPIVWTTIATGKGPEKHGVSNEIAVRSYDRRVMALWQMLGAVGERTLVVNVPGTAPAESIEGHLLAGFPIRGESFNNLGYVFSEQELDWKLPGKPGQMGPFQLSSDENRVCIDLREIPADGDVTTLGDLFGRIGATRPLVARLAKRRYGRFCLDRATDGSLHVPVGESTSSALRPGDWTPWMLIGRDGAPVAFRLRMIDDTPGATAVYATALFDVDPVDRMTPPELAAELDSRFGPYIVEGTGWLLFQVPQLVRPLAEHQFDVADRRLVAAGHVWERESWDSLFYVLTLTDRIQHPFWMFLDHARYGIKQHPDAGHGTINEHTRGMETIVEDAYRWSDRALGRLIAQAGEDTIIAVLSDHGATSGSHRHAPGAGIHHPYGFYVLAGGPFDRESAGMIAEDERLYDDPRLNGETLVHEDVTPTLLAALGLPLGRDFDGTPSDLILRRMDELGIERNLIESWDPTTDKGPGRTPRADEALMEQLRSLGYVQ